MEFLGEPLILRPIRQLSALASKILVVTNSPGDYGFLKLELVSDSIPGMGALGGLYTGLLASKTPLIANVGCDMPFVSLPLLQEELRILMENPSLAFVIPRSEYGFEPMHAVYRKNKSLPAIKAALDRGERRMISWHDDVDSPFYLEIEEVRRFDPDGLAFMNLNTPEEFSQAAQIGAGLSGKY